MIQRCSEDIKSCIFSKLTYFFSFQILIHHLHIWALDGHEDWQHNPPRTWQAGTVPCICPIKEIYCLSRVGCEERVAHISYHFRGRQLDPFRGSRCGMESSIETSWRRIEILPTSSTALLPSLLSLRDARSPTRPPGRSAVLSPPSLAHSGGGGEGARARACQGQLTSVTFSAIHWLFADSGGAMMDCPARADERPRRPREGRARRGGKIRGGGTRQPHLRGTSRAKKSLKIIST